MTTEAVDMQEVVDIRKCPGCSGSLRPDATKQRRYCSESCRQRAKDQRKNRRTSGNRGTSGNRRRRPLPDFAHDVGWNLRKDVERLERIVADDRFATYRQQVSAQLRGHLEYAAEVCQDLLSRLDNPGRE